MNFLQSLTKQVSKQTVPEGKTTQEPTASGKDQPKKIRFTHSNNVILKNGNYKGYFGSIYRIQPSRYEILLKEVEYVFVKTYGKKPIGSTIYTEFGESKIMEHVPVLYNIVYELTGEVLRYPEQYLKRVIVFKDTEEKNALRVGLLAGIQEINKKKIYAIHQYNLSYDNKDTPQTLMQKLEEKMIKTRDHDSILNIKKQKFSDDTEELASKMKESLSLTEKKTQLLKYIPESNILSEMYMVVSEAKDPHFAKYGKLTHIIDEQYMIMRNIFTLVSQFNVKLDSKKAGKIGDTCTILHGAFKNRSGTIVNIFPEILTVFVDAIGKKINSFEKVEDGKRKSYSLTKNDIFYTDIRLRNGNFFEVSKILENGAFSGTERIPGKGFVPRDITDKDIDIFMSGFAQKEISVSKQETEKDEYASDVELVEGTEEQTVSIEDMDEDDETMSLGDYVEVEAEEEPATPEEKGKKKGKKQAEEQEEEQDEKMEEQEQDEDTKDEKEYLASFKDVERSQLVARVLTQEEESIKSSIISILNGFELNENSIKMYNVIDTVNLLINKIKEMVNKVMENYWKTSDEKYIIGCVMLYELLRQETSSKVLTNGNVMDNYLNKITKFSTSFFNENDLNGTIFLTQGWTTLFNVNKQSIITLIKNKKYNEIYKIMLDNCHTVVQSILPANERMSLEKRVRKESQEEELIPLGIRKRKTYEQKIIYSKDILAGNIPKTADKIVWGPSFQNTINKYRTLLKNKIEGNEFDPEKKEWKFKRAPNKITKEIYTYVLTNLDQGPIALREMKETLKTEKSKTNEKKYSELERFFNMLVNDIREIDTQQKQKIRSSLEKIQSEEETVKKRRAEIELRNRLMGLNIDEEELEYENGEIKPKKKRTKK